MRPNDEPRINFIPDFWNQIFSGFLNSVQTLQYTPLVSGMIFLQPIPDTVFSEGCSYSFHFLYLGYSLGIMDDLDHSDRTASGQTTIRDHSTRQRIEVVKLAFERMTNQVGA